MQAKVSDIIVNQGWRLPLDWFNRFDVLNTISIPSLHPNTRDRVVWRVQGIDHEFSSSMVWNSIREVGALIDWCEIVWFSNPIPRHAFVVWLIIKQKLKKQDKLKDWDNTTSTRVCSLCS